MREYLKGIFSGAGADYIEARIQESHVTRIEFRGKALETISQSVDFGGNIRALVDGSWGFVSFNGLSDLEKKAEAAVRQARLASARSTGKAVLAEVPAVRDIVGLDVKADMRSVPLARKKEILEGYNDIVLSYGGPIASSFIKYADSYSKITFANSEGTYIEQEKADMGGNIRAIASKGGETQQYSVPFGTSNNFNALLGLEDEIAEACKTACSLLDAPVVEGGEYTVVLNPHLAGVFVHEAFGHLSEADSIYENEGLKQVMVLGRTFGSKELNIYDTGLTPGARGYMKYDDEGVATEKTYLIREGKLVGRLHSRETAGRMGEKPTGNARALDYSFSPIVRMRNTSIAAGQASFDDMLSGIGRGIYAIGAYGGETAGEMFTFTAAKAYMIRDGKICELVKNATLSGNVFTTLANIDMIGSDFTAYDTGGGCGKNGQSPLPTSEWCPHIRIRKALIGGRD